MIAVIIIIRRIRILETHLKKNLSKNKHNQTKTEEGRKEGRKEGEREGGRERKEEEGFRKNSVTDSGKSNAVEPRVNI